VASKDETKFHSAPSFPQGSEGKDETKFHSAPSFPQGSEGKDETKFHRTRATGWRANK